MKLKYLIITLVISITCFSCNGNKNEIIGGKWYPFSVEKDGKTIIAHQQLRENPEIIPRYLEFVDDHEMKDVSYDLETGEIKRIKIRKYLIKGDTLIIKHQYENDTKAAFSIDNDKLIFFVDDSKIIYERK